MILVAAGFAPVFPERALDDPALGAARRAVDLILAAHEPNPAILVDLRWNMIGANAAVGVCWRASPLSCWNRPSMFCTWPSIPRAWRRGSSISLNGGPTSWNACADKSS